LRKIRLLLVDDEEDFRTPIASILSGSGMEVVEAGSAQQMDTLLQAGGRLLMSYCLTSICQMRAVYR